MNIATASKKEMALDQFRWHVKGESVKALHIPTGWSSMAPIRRTKTAIADAVKLSYVRLSNQLKSVGWIECKPPYSEEEPKKRRAEKPKSMKDWKRNDGA